MAFEGSVSFCEQKEAAHTAVLFCRWTVFLLLATTSDCGGIQNRCVLSDNRGVGLSQTTACSMLGYFCLSFFRVDMVQQLVPVSYRIKSSMDQVCLGYY